MGAWIETPEVASGLHPQAVAPLGGAWIESKRHVVYECHGQFAPLVGAWIETKINWFVEEERASRTPRGCVD